MTTEQIIKEAQDANFEKCYGVTLWRSEYLGKSENLTLKN